MAGGTKLCPSVYIFSSGVVAAVSPKSYRYMPRVSEGHASGSTATTRTFLPLNLSARKGNVSPDMLLPPPDPPDHHVRILTGQLHLPAGLQTDDGRIRKA